MSTRQKRVLFMLPATLLPAALLAATAASCEVAVNLDPAVIDAGAQTDVLDCGICADVSADAQYSDAGDASIYGLQPGDAGADGAVQDAAARDGAR